MNKAWKSQHFRLYFPVLKRLCDFIASLLLLIIFFIPGIVIALLIKFTSQGPVFFRQERVGKDGQLFTIYKFRSMSVNAPHAMATTDFSDANNYITSCGRFIRKTSIDELPQLFNVLKGDMSIIGPRPLISAEVQINQARHRTGVDRLLPGITGLAQVNGRDTLNDQQKLAYDLKYYQNVSLILDIKILFRTVVNVLISKDIRDGQK